MNHEESPKQRNIKDPSVLPNPVARSWWPVTDPKKYPKAKRSDILDITITLSQELNIKPWQVENTIKLIDEGTQFHL